MADGLSLHKDRDFDPAAVAATYSRQTTRTFRQTPRISPPPTSRGNCEPLPDRAVGAASGSGFDGRDAPRREWSMEWLPSEKIKFGAALDELKAQGVSALAATAAPRRPPAGKVFQRHHRANPPEGCPTNDASETEGEHFAPGARSGSCHADEETGQPAGSAGRRHQEGAPESAAPGPGSASAAAGGRQGRFGAEGDTGSQCRSRRQDFKAEEAMNKAAG